MTDAPKQSPIHTPTLLRTGEYSSRGKQKLTGVFEASSYAPAGSFGNTYSLWFLRCPLDT
jgi:hypothetical protein